jgi:hypothetical protein
MPYPSPTLNGKIYYVPGNPDIYWIDNGFARHIPDEATYNGVFGGSPNKQAYSGLLTDVATGAPIADGTQLVRAGNDANIYFVEGNTKRLIPTEAIKAAFQLNGNVHSLPLATVNSFANGPAFADPFPPSGPEPVPGRFPPPKGIPEPNPFPDPGPDPGPDPDPDPDPGDGGKLKPN